MHIRLLIGVAGALALAACSNETESEDTAVAEATATPAAGSAEMAADTSSPQGFVTMAASSDMYEIEAGRLAGQNATNADIKAFGAMLVTDHTASSEKLKAAATEAGSLALPTAMTAKHEGMLTQLRNAGENFDRVFAEQQVAAHQEALTLLQTQAQSGTAEPLKAFASETAPVIETHLAEARELATAAGGTAAGGAAAGAGSER